MQKWQPLVRKNKAKSRHNGYNVFLSPYLPYLLSKASSNFSTIEQKS
jgi:hypothetical protein